MKFGAVPDHLLAGIDLRLPPEPARNAQVLRGKRQAAPRVYIGGANWGDTTWIGQLYPLKTPAKNFRQEYPRHFNTIELNATHYNIYSPSVIRGWAAAAKGKDFKYCPKFPQLISHQNSFRQAITPTHAFLESIAAFEENLGPAFLQLSEHFSPLQRDALLQYLALLPKDRSFFLEVRHPQWFMPPAGEALFTALQALHIGAVITDAPGRRDAVHLNLTVPRLLLRFVCNALHPTTFSRTDAWVERISTWLERGMEEVYVFLHPGSEAAVPPLAAYWVQALNTRCGLALQPPARLQGRLF